MDLMGMHANNGIQETYNIGESMRVRSGQERKWKAGGKWKKAKVCYHHLRVKGMLHLFIIKFLAKDRNILHYFNQTGNWNQIAE
jgi:hypothetical protein